MPDQLTSPSGVAGLRRTPCDVPGNVRRVPAQWVRRRKPRLAMLVSRPGTVPTNAGQIVGGFLAGQPQKHQIVPCNGPVMERCGQQHAGGAGALKL